MSVPDTSIDPRLLSAAKQEFLEKGFEKASLARICKAAGVTTGALYKRYKGKEDLFFALVSDTLCDIEKHAEEIEKTDLSKFTDQELYDGFAMTPESILQWMSILYEHKEGFTLLVRCAAGTRYGSFHHDWAQRMNVLSYMYYQEAYRRGLASKELTQEEMYLYTSAFWTLYYEPFYFDYSWEQLQQHARMMNSFISWHGLLEMNDPGNSQS